MDLEILTWSIAVSAEPKEKVKRSMDGRNHLIEETDLGSDKRIRSVDFGNESGRHDCPVYDRYSISPADQIRGPAIITESQTTIVVPPSWIVVSNQHGDLLISREVVSKNKTRGSNEHYPKLSAVRRQVIWDRLISIVEEQIKSVTTART